MLDLASPAIFVSLPLAAENPLNHVVDHAIVKTSGGWWVLTNHMVMLMISAALMLLIFPKMTKRYRDGEHVPTGTRNFFEAIMLYMRDDVVKPLLGPQTTAYIPYLWTLFFFILFTNILGLLPLDIPTQAMGLGAKHHGLFGTATGNFWVTASLALVTFCVVQISGIRANGLLGWMHHFLGGAPWYVAIIMIPVEIMGMLIKPFALAVRLAANMTAGHILLAVIIGFVPAAFAALGVIGGGTIGVVSVVSAVAIMCLELFVAFLQAYLFTFLTALFISQMVVHDEAHGGDEHGHGHGHEQEFHNGHPVTGQELTEARLAGRAHQV
jgi:F-type H+-transporting ATPase subunit a